MEMLTFRRGEDIAIEANSAGNDVSALAATLRRQEPCYPRIEAPFQIIPDGQPGVFRMMIPADVTQQFLPGFYVFNLAFTSLGARYITEETTVTIDETTTL